MCGICGFINLDRRRPADRGVLESMRDAIRHRGPNDAGALIDGAIGLGHRRLSIIDIAGGHQPMANEDESIWIVFNGEVYNYIELRARYLEGRHRFASSSDTEVMIHLYEEFGKDCVTHFNGMFAFAMWDRRTQTLLLARDRVGVKPLYYTVQAGAFIFASEIKAILQHPGVARRVDPVAVDEFMTYGYVQGARTAFDGIFRLPEGHTLTLRDGAIAIERYWDLEFKPDETRSEQDHIDRVRELLDDAIRLRLRSDVPLGVLLSGGVDSSAVVGLLSRDVGRIKTYSIGFDAGHEYNELHHARRLAQHFGTDHHETILAPDVFRDFIPNFVYYMDEPVTEAAAVSLYYVCELAARDVTVILSGEGSDELFAGYPIYRYMRMIERYRRVPSAVRGMLEPVMRGLRPDAKLDKYLTLAAQPLEQRYLNVHLYDPRLRRALYTTDFAAAGHQDPFEPIAGIYEHTRHWDLLSRLLYLDTRSWLPNDILIKADRMSMAKSLELRVPFLDYRLIEYAATIPSRYKLRGATTKYILKAMLKDVVPPWVLDRKKMGFPTPLSLMFRKQLSGYVRDTLTDATIRRRGYFEPSTVHRLVDEHMAGAEDHHSALWRMIIMEEWHRQFIDGVPVKPRTAEAQVPTPSAVTA
jgi:asparagine synthase (glutamine-hydrolysing)